MKVSVLGAGAIGSMFGGLIRQHDPRCEVLFVGRGEHGRAVCHRGAVRLRGPWGSYDVRVDASSQAADLAGSDFVLFCVKSHATAEAIQAAAPYLGDAVVISIQNGINEPVLSRYVDDQRLVMGMTATNMAVAEPGVVSLQLDGPTLVGPNAQGTNRQAAESAAELLRKTDLFIKLHPNMLGTRYNKLAINALGSASCLSRSNFITGALTYRPWRDALARPILEECLTTFRRAGVRLARIPNRPGVSQLMRLTGWLDTPVVGSVVGSVSRRLYNKQPILFSLCEDLRRGKTTEIDYINGEIVRLAESAGIDARYNRKVVELVHHLEGRTDESFFSRDEVIEKFRTLAAAPAAPQPRPTIRVQNDHQTTAIAQKDQT